MRQLTILLGCGLACLSCLQDPEIDSNDPVAPSIQYEDLTCTSVTLIGKTEKAIIDATYGFVITEIINGEKVEGSKDEIISQLNEENTFLGNADLTIGMTYSIQAFISNGQSRKYSSPITLTTPLTTKATLSTVTLVDGYLIASVQDNGGRIIEDVGFVGGDSPDRKSLLRKEKIPATKNNGQYFSLPLNTFEPGRTYYFIAYAIDEKEDVGYSPDVFRVEDATIQRYHFSGLSLPETTLSLPVGGEHLLTAVIAGQNTNDFTIIWTSSNEDVAIVTENGLVKALTTGTCIITADCYEKKASCSITVSDSGISFNELNREVYIGENFTLSPFVWPIDLGNNSLIWSSSDLNVARVSEGVVSPTGIGVATITATTPLGDTASIDCIVVSEAPVFPDDAFNNYVYEHFDKDKNGFLSRKEALEITTIDVKGHNENGSYSSLSGIEYFVNLRRLSCGFNGISELNVSNNPNLSELICDHNQLSFLDVANNPNLTYLSCGGNQLTVLDVANNPKLTSLMCDCNLLTSLDVSNKPRLDTLFCNENRLSSLDISSTPDLQYLRCQNNMLTSLDITHNPNLLSLNCTNNLLTNLSLSPSKNLHDISCENNKLSSLIISDMISLTSVFCNDNKLTTLNISNTPNLTELSCPENQLTDLNLTSIPSITKLWCENNQLSDLELSKNPKLYLLNCSNNQLSFLDVSKNPLLHTLICKENSNLHSIRLKSGQSIPGLECDSWTTLSYE